MKRRGFLRRCSADTHWTRGAINAVHFSHGAVPLRLVGEFDKPVTLGPSGDGVGDDLGASNRRVMSPKSFLEEEISDVRGKIADEDGVVRAGVAAAAGRSPVESEGLFGSGHEGSVVGVENAFGGGVGDELDEAVALRLAGDLVADDLDGENIAGVCEALREVVFVDPVL